MMKTDVENYMEEIINELVMIRTCLQNLDQMTVATIERNNRMATIHREIVTLQFALLENEA